MAYNWLFVWSSVGYAPFTLFIAAQIWRYRMRKYRRLQLLYILLTLSFVCRIIWFARRGTGSNDLFEGLVNRVSLLSFFSGFYIYVLSWGSVFAFEHNPRMTTPGFWIVNVVLYLAVFSSTVASYLYCVRCPIGDMLYDINIMLIVLVYVILASILGVLGCRLQCNASRWLKSGFNAAFRRRLTLKLMVATTICVLCFALRCVMFMYRPITRIPNFGPVDAFFYPWCFYHVPEVVPAVTMMAILAPRPVAVKAISVGQSDRSTAMAGDQSTSNMPMATVSAAPASPSAAGGAPRVGQKQYYVEFEDGDQGTVSFRVPTGVIEPRDEDEVDTLSVNPLSRSLVQHPVDEEA